MARVLISFLGTGTSINQQTKNTGSVNYKEPREYRRANYHINDKNLGEHTFVSLALRKAYNADKAIMIGTVHSMWEEVYRYLRYNTDTNYQPLDDPVYFEIAEHCETSNYQSELYLPHKEEIEKELGKDSHVVLIKYGLTESDINKNINIILSLEKYIHNGDEIIIDITHSFRSLPILITQLLMYLKTISKKDITISHVFYGMLDITNELNGKTPIVDLTSILNINDWIIGAYALQNYANGSKIADLIKNEDKSVSKLLSDFSNAMNLNHIMAIKSQIPRLASIINKQYNSNLPKVIIPETIKKFVETFRNIDKQSLFELKLAEWQAKHHNYTSAYISMIEACVSFICEKNKLNLNDFEDREKAKRIIRGQESGNWKCDSTITEKFPHLNRQRNSLAHSIEAGQSLISMIKELNDGIKTFMKIIN